jgi:hypothetical protein
MNWTVAKIETLGRTRLSTNFCMREMLYSEIAQVNGMVTRWLMRVHLGDYEASTMKLKRLDSA